VVADQFGAESAQATASTPPGAPAVHDPAGRQLRSRKQDALDDSNGEVVAIATRRIEDVPTSTKTPIGRGSVAGWRRTNQERRTELWSVAAP
jgi:hypothetical protein